MNIVAEVGLILLVASFSAWIGNYTASLRPSYALSAPPIDLKPEGYAGFCELLKSYRYDVMVDARGGEVRFMVLTLEGFLSSGEGFSQKALVNSIVRGSGRLSFKLERRGVYVTVIENIGDREVFLSYVSTFRREFEQDFLGDSAIVASAGALLLTLGLILERTLKKRR